MSSTPLSPSDLARLGQLAMRKRTELGLHCGPTPLGFRRVYSEVLQAITIEPDPTTAPIIVLMLQMKREGSSVRGIQDFAHRQGLRTRRSMKLGVSAVQHILTSPIYRGLVRTPEADLIAGVHTPLTTDD